MSERKKIHLLNTRPHIYELDDMMEFCQNYKHLYIYGTAENQEYLLKYMDLCDVKIDGYVVTERSHVELHYREIPVYEFNEIKEQESAGIIIGLSERHYGQVIPMLRNAGFTDYFLLTEHSKNGFREQLTVRSQDDMTFEINLADHCNLSCQMCDHYSQLADECFVDMDVFERDMIRMGELFDHKIACITLLGGEPTLHKNIIKCMEITRREFPDAELIILTNGTLLLKLENSPEGNIWQACKDYRFHITVTVYPINFDYAALEEKAKEYSIILAMSSNIHATKLTKIVKISTKHTKSLTGEAEPYHFVNCLYMNKFNVLKDGKFYACPISAHVGIFNRKFNQNIPHVESDYIDIYKAKDWHELAEFGAKYVPMCRYCDLKKWHHHGQWKPSTMKIDEYIIQE